MEIVLNERWKYQLLKDGEDYVLSVLCGSVAPFEVNVKLNSEQISDFQKYGKTWCDNFSEKIRQNPERYM